MTTPAVCTCGTVHLDSCPGEMSVCLSPGFVFDGTVQLLDRFSKLPTDWPVGTETRMRINWGTGTELIIPGTVDDSYLRFHMDASETEQIARGSLVTIDINYDGDPDMWRPWRWGRVGGCR